VAEVYSLFDAILESRVLGVRKPDPRFYELACEALDVEPHECVFLDDLGVNLKPARALGMHTIKVTDPEVALAELGELTGLSRTD
jgi:putative hydrolase of the HAD superfamily